MLTVACWKYERPAYHKAFLAEYVNVLRRSVARHYPRPHEFVCITDDPSGLDAEIRAVPLPTRWLDVPHPRGDGWPACYVRLEMFDRAWALRWLGRRFVCLDVDIVVTRDLVPVFDRPEDFVILRNAVPERLYGGGMVMMDAGARQQVFDRFDPETSPAASQHDGLRGSDQAWIPHVLGPDEATWGPEHGVYHFMHHLRSGRSPLPADARLVQMYARDTPWESTLPWVREHWR